MRLAEVEIYTLDELPERSQEKAYDYWVSACDYGWGGENTQSLKKFEEHMPIKIKDWEYDTYSYNVRFELNVDDGVEELTGVRLATWLWNHYNYVLYTGKWYGKFYPKVRRSRILLEENSPTGYCIDYSLWQPIRDFINKPDSRNLKELIQDCLDNWGRDCSNDYADSMSKERFIEEASECEYMFTIDGKQYYE